MTNENKQCPRCGSDLEETESHIQCPNGDFKALKSKWYAGEKCKTCGNELNVLMEGWNRVGTWCRHCKE